MYSSQRQNVKILLGIILALFECTLAVPPMREALMLKMEGATKVHPFSDYPLQTFTSFDLDDGDGRGDPHMPGWKDPNAGGGSMLDLVGNGLREPINVILSGHSDSYILSDAGLRDYVRTIGFSFECLDLHIGGLQRANLGDGNGWITEMFEFRQTESWGAPGRWIGACWETFRGGNHFRAWKQNGTEANTGAWFLAVSTEKVCSL